MHGRWIKILLVSIGFLLFANNIFAGVKGIYITSSTMQNTAKITHLIKQAKSVGIDTFVVDVEKSSKRFAQNVGLLKQNGIRFVARVVVFPQGGTPERVKSMEYREKKFRLIELAKQYGAEEIQLDYIRYDTKQGSSSQHAIDIANVIRWFREKLGSMPLQVDVFGIASFKPEHNIGQDVLLFAKYVDTICPMNYPSHFEPFAFHSAKPYETIFKALSALKEQFDGKVPVKIITWIETSNYRYAWTSASKKKYIAAQIRAANDSGINGWYAWSPNNLYDNLFAVLAENKNL